MILQNPFTRGYVDYPLYFNPETLNYHIRHETPFTERWSEWAVSIVGTGDTIYLPYGQNRCKNIYIVTSDFMSKKVKFPEGIYIIPMSFFTTPMRNDEAEMGDSWDEFDDFDEFDDDDDYFI